MHNIYIWLGWVPLPWVGNRVNAKMLVCLFGKGGVGAYRH